MIQFRPALSSKANDSDEYYGDDDDGDGGHDPHPHSPQVPCSRVPNENHSNTCSSVHESKPNRNSAWSDKRPIQFSRGGIPGGGGACDAATRHHIYIYIYIYIYRGLVFLSDSLLNLELFTAAGVMKFTEQGKGISRGHMQWPLGRTLT